LEKLKRREYFGDLGTDGRIVLKWIVMKCEGVGWIHVALDRDQ
jgi:hypothetical protein